MDGRMAGWLAGGLVGLANKISSAHDALVLTVLSAVNFMLFAHIFAINKRMVNGIIVTNKIGNWNSI